MLEQFSVIMPIAEEMAGCARVCTIVNLRRHALVGTELASACTATLRVKLLKVAAAIVRNTRRVRIMLASNHPMRAIFASAAQALAP